MGKLQIVKCKYCKKEIERNIAFKHPTKERIYFCGESCYQEYKEKQNNKQKTVDKHFTMLTDFIQELYGKNCNWPWIMAQVKFYQKEYNFTYLGMLIALRYYVIIEENNFDLDMGLGQVLPRYYEIAQNYTNHCKKISALCQEDYEDEIVVIKKSKRRIRYD